MKIKEFKNSLEQSFHFEFLNYEVDIVIELEGDEPIEGFGKILGLVTSWDKGFFEQLEPMLFGYYDETLAMCGEECPVIQTKKDIWGFLRIGAIYLFLYEGQYYAMVSGGCDWEGEHGLEFDVNEMNQILYVGSFISNGFHEDPGNPSTHNYVAYNL